MAMDSSYTKLTDIPAEHQADEVLDVGESKSSKKLFVQGRGRLIVGMLCLLVGVGVGVGAGYAISTRQRDNPCDGCRSKSSDNVDHVHAAGVESLSASRLGQQLQYLTRLPHLAGSARNKALADYVATQWKQSHVDRVEIKSYSVLLSYPNTTQPNTVSITTANKTVVYECSKVEPPLTNDENTSNVTPPFNAYAASGVAHGELVYVNYGRVEDFQTLEKWNIDVRGKVAIARYGRIFRGDKARIAELAGMSGLILYSDPADVSGNSMNSESTYPHTWWLPSTGLQRGTLLLMDGDPLTPGYPSIPGAYRRSLADVKNDTLPHIPVQPISAKDAAILMSDLSGQVVPRTANGSNWQGGLGFVYHTGPGYEENTTKSNQHVSMKVHNTLEVQTIYNVIGTIDGSEEPDRYVLLGNHRDAWVFGGADPSSGTACLIEIVRAFGTLLASGWRPRRTIKFLSWDAEEYGLIGSTEWVEENSQILSKRAVAYLNVDIAVQGNYSIRAAASPLLYQTLYEAAKLVPSPTHDFSSLYDLWLHRTPKYPDNDVPYIGNLGSGSDYTAFQQHIGISSVDMRYNYDYTKYHISSYPTYHSIHDTFQYMTEFLDPQFQCHTTISKLWMQSALILSDRISLMFDLRDYSSALTQHVDELKSKYGDVLREKGISLEHLSHAVLNFSVIALELSQRADPCSELGWRMFNDQLMQLDRMFIVPSGLPGRPFLRHVVFAPSLHNSYRSSTFPGIADALFGDSPNWELVKQQVSIAYMTIRQAAASLQAANTF